jgi:hypothetical protein
MFSHESLHLFIIWGFVNSPNSWQRARPLNAAQQIFGFLSQRPGFEPGKAICDLRWKHWNSDRIPVRPSVPLVKESTDGSRIIIRDCTVGQILADVTIGPRLTPPQDTERKKERKKGLFLTSVCESPVAHIELTTAMLAVALVALRCHSRTFPWQQF